MAARANISEIRVIDSPAFYYPDVLVACDPSDNDAYFRERPTVVFEVLSPETERTDQREKRFAYALVPSLKVYVIIAQDKWQLTVLHRGRGGPWKAETVEGRNAVLKLPQVKLEIPLARIYERTKAAHRVS